MKKIFFLPAIFYLLVSCEYSSTTEIESPASIDLSGDIPKLNYQALIDDLVLIPLESSEKASIGKIDKILWAENKYFIMDTYKAEAVFYFDDEGKLILKLDEKGQGPGQFYLPFDIVIDQANNRLKVADVRQRKINNYDFNGTFIDEEKLFDQVESFTILDANYYAFHLSGHDAGWDYFDFLHIRNKEQQDYALSGVRDIGSTDMFSIMHEFSTYGDRTLFMHACTDTIYAISPESIVPAYIINFGRLRMTQEQKAFEPTQMMNYFMNHDYRLHNGKICENTEYISFRWVQGVANLKDGIKYTTYLDKSTQEYITIPEAQNWKAGISIKGPFTTAGEFFIGYIQPFENDLAALNQVLQENGLAVRVNENSNPILVIFNLKGR